MKKAFILFLCFFLFQISLYGQAGEVGNVPAKNTSRLPLPAGPSVVGVFDGRSPCQEMAKQLNEKTIPECTKIKWRLVLYQDPKTYEPTTYKLEGFVYRNPPREGKWTVIRGTKNDPMAIVYQLDPDKPDRSIYILKADDNVLFFMDKDKNLMVGNNDFSYTLNRTGE
ncbi:MAG: hypothetical protein JWQ54_1003 [Mucilaginibacter sp.]|nr:hypothetical protein [Mucilaginibacter sp.]